MKKILILSILLNIINCLSFFENVKNVLKDVVKDIKKNKLINPKGISFPKENGITILTDNTFDEAMKEYDYILLIFYAPWCDICRMAFERLEYFKKEIETEYPNVLLAKIDGSFHKYYFDKYDLEGYPSILLFKNGENLGEYHSKDYTTVIDWLYVHLKPDVTVISGEDNLNAYKNKYVNKKPIISLFCRDCKENDSIYKSFEKVAKELKHKYYFINANLPFITYKKLGGINKSLMVFKSFDEESILMSKEKELNYENIIQFINIYCHPSVISYKTYIHSLNSDENHLGLFAILDLKKDNNKDNDNIKLYNVITNKISLKYRENFQTIIVDINTSSGKRFYASLRTKELPLLIIYDNKKYSKFYKYNQTIYGNEYNEEAIDKFINDWKNELLRNKEFIKTPGKSASNVQKLNKNNWNENVILNDNDVFVKFYAPWCGHCKRLEPIFAGLSNKLSNNTKLKFYEVDSTKETIPGIKISGYPTLIFFKGNDKQNHLIFRGERTYENLLAFIKKHSTNPIL